ncbi:MAG: GAF domain-containing protein [Thermoanaerobaculia bacterium]|nr:GAF domain-containing protein [Thermoanaerobaculia bacterium]
MKRSTVLRGPTRGCPDEVTAFLAAARAVLDNRGFTEAARSILEVCRTTIGADAGFVAVKARGENDFEIVVVDSTGLELDVAGGMPPGLARLGSRASRAGRVAFSNKLTGSVVVEAAPAGREVALQSALVAPIVLAGNVAGLVCLVNQPGGFTPVHARLAEVFAEMAAVSMRNSRTAGHLASSRDALEEAVHAGAAQLWQSEGHFRALVENLPDIVARFDRDLRYLYVSPTIQRLTGRPVEEFPGKTNREVGMPDEVTRLWDSAIRRVVSSGRPEMIELEFPGLAATRYFDCRLVPERGVGGAIQSVLSVARDVSERWLAHEAERKARTVSDALRETTVLLNRSLDRESVMGMLLDCLRRLVPFDRARVMLLEEGPRVSVRATFDGTRVVPSTPDVRVEFDPIDHPIVQRILTNGTAVCIPDIGKVPDWSLPVDRSSEVSWMGVPLFARGDVSGLVSLSKREPDYFSEEHVRLAEAMSSQASVAVENSVLFSQMQVSTSRMQALSRRILEVQEDERRHIARELHDEAGQALVSLRYGLRLLERQIEKGESITERVTDLVERTDAVIDGLHRLAADLRPASLDHLGLEAALRQYARTAGAGLGLTVRFKSRGFSGERFPPALETALYRVVQEAMANVVRHASATRVDILAEHRGDKVIVMIEDDGGGFDPSDVRREGSFGMLGMAERAEALGGTFAVESAPGAGTTIVVEVPDANSHPDR